MGTEAISQFLPPNQIQLEKWAPRATVNHLQDTIVAAEMGTGSSSRNERKNASPSGILGTEWAQNGHGAQLGKSEFANSK